jgi:hypothetical protein
MVSTRFSPFPTFQQIRGYRQGPTQPTYQNPSFVNGAQLLRILDAREWTASKKTAFSVNLVHCNDNGWIAGVLRP